jgi:acetamidase/formamidase
MKHVLDRSRTCNRWNRDYPPVLTIASGDTVSIAMKDSSDGQVRPDMTSAEFSQIDPTRIHALTGPITIEGAQPGDALEIEFLEFRHEGWGWTGIIPPMGLLGDEFGEHFLQVWKLEDAVTRSIPGVTLALHPFCGVIGVQRAEAGEFRTRAPGAFGGNMDVRQLGAGARLFLPVFTPGAGLCAGDAHAAQGDGEVSINGLEAPMTVTVRVHVRKGLNLAGPQAIVGPALLPPRYTAKPFHAFIESHENPREACRAAVRRAIAYLMGRLGISRQQALVLCSVVLDLRISQMVNGPVMTISALIPEAIFDHGNH